MLYFGLFLFLISVYYIFGSDPRGNRISYNVVIVFLFLFCAFRFEVGCDWSGYLNQYHLQGLALSIGVERDAREPLWWLILEIQQRAGLHYVWLNIFSAIVLFLGIHVLSLRQPDRLAFITLLYPVLIINAGMTQMRQGVAIGIMCIAYVAFSNRRTLVFVILTVIAAGFHNSALVFLLLAPLVRGSLTNARLLLMGILSIPGLLLLVSSGAGEVAIERYVERDVEAAGAIFRVGLLVLTSIFFIMFVRKYWKKESNYNYEIIFLGSAFMLGLAPLIIYSTVIGDRFGYYLVPIQALIFSRIRFIIPNGNVIFIVFLFVLSVMLLVWTSYSAHFEACYLPYQTWILGIPDSSRYLY